MYICYNIFFPNEFSNFFWNLFDSKTINVKNAKNVTFSAFTYNAIQGFSFDSYSTRFIDMPHPLFLDKLFLE